MSVICPELNVTLTPESRNVFAAATGANPRSPVGLSVEAIKKIPESAKNKDRSKAPPDAVIVCRSHVHGRGARANIEFDPGRQFLFWVAKTVARENLPGAAKILRLN